MTVKNSLLSLQFQSEGSLVPSAVRSGWTPVLLRGVALGAALGTGCLGLEAPTAPPQSAGSVERANVGDAPDDPGPLATRLSAELRSKGIDSAIKKVADWQ